MPDIMNYVDPNGFQMAANFRKYKSFQSDVGREICVRIYNGTGFVEDDHIHTVINNITTTHGSLGAATMDPWVVGAMGTADGSAYDATATTEIFMRLQGTGQLDVTAAVAGTPLTCEIVAYFAPLH